MIPRSCRRQLPWRIALIALGVTAAALLAQPVPVVALAAGAARRAIQDPAQAAATTRSVWDGVFTDAQARRGEVQYGRSCAACHGADLSGNPVEEIPSLVWDAFLTQWNGRTVKDLFDTVKRSMPRDSPGTLNTRAYVDVIAYLLEANKLPVGTRDLSLSPDALAQIVIDKDRK